MTLRFKHAIIILILFISNQVFTQTGLITIEVSTPNSFIVLNEDTMSFEKIGSKKIELNHGSYKIEHFKDAFLTRTKDVNLTSSTCEVQFDPLVEIPILTSSEKRIILNSVTFEELNSILFRTYVSKSRFKSNSSRVQIYYRNMEKRFDPFVQKNEISRFLQKHDFVEDTEKHGFTITENNVNLDIDVTSISFEGYRSDMERCSFDCKFRLLDLNLTPLDSVTFFCSIENNFGPIQITSMVEVLIEKMCNYLNSASWKGILDADGAKRENKKFSLTTEQNVHNYIEARKAVVTITTEKGHGSGCSLTRSGLVVTNAHVIKGSEWVTVITFDGDTIQGKVADYNPLADLAIIQLEDSVNYVFSLDEKNSTEIGTKVFAIGSPLSPLLAQSISDGIVSSKLLLNGVNYIQTDAKVNGGNSGGALVDENGKLLGIVNAKIVDFSVEGISFAIPVSEILNHFSSDE